MKVTNLNIKRSSTLPKIGNKDNIIIIGYPGTGKTTFAKELFKANEGYVLVHSDMFAHMDYKHALYALIAYIQGIQKKYKNPIMVEGILGYRLLRKIEKESLDILGSPHVINLTNTSYTKQDNKMVSHLKTISDEIGL